MDINTQISAKQKAVNVINSCETLEQCETAMNYIYLYHDLSGDDLGFHNLSTDLNEIIDKMSE